MFASPAPNSARPQVTFAQFSHGDRRGWVRGAALRDLESAWVEETRELRDEARKQSRAVELLSKLNIFGMGTLKQDAADSRAVELALAGEEGAAAKARKKDSSTTALLSNLMGGSDLLPGEA